MTEWVREFAPIAILLIVVGVVIARLPRVEGLNHSPEFRRRRVLNWLPLGLTYAFLYMGRYNLNVSKFRFEEMQAPSGGALMGNDDFGIIFMVGTWVYGVSFLINGPLTDRFGGRKAILAGAAGAAIVNFAMAGSSHLLVSRGPGFELVADNFLPLMCLLYGANMYFQSFGAVAIVKCNAPWFHVRERGVFGAIFGILISLGIYFAYDWGDIILEHLGVVWVFLVPAVLLAAFFLVDLLVVRNSPGEAGHKDFDLADASSHDDGPRLGAVEVFKRMMRNPIIVTIALIEFCSGFQRQAIMQWYRTFAKQTDLALHLKGDFVYKNWGMLLCCAGILGGVVAGVISDHLFKSRRGPVAVLLYGVMAVGALLLLVIYDAPPLFHIGGFAFYGQAWLVILMSMAVIGVHGMLSGTASMDFGGKKNVGVAVGIIDGFVYLGTGAMSLTYSIVLPKEQFDEAGKLTGPVLDPANWIGWPLAMVPFTLIGMALAFRVWHATPKGKAASSGH